MTAATLQAPTAAPTAARRRGPNPNANSKRLDRALLVWSQAMAVLSSAADACDALADAMGELLPDEADAIHGDDVREDAWHAAYFIRNQLSLVESSATPDVVALARRPS